MAPWWQLILPFASRPENHPEKHDVPFLNHDGYVDFRPDDPENPRNWSAARRWWITFCSTFLILNGTLASGVPSGCLTSLTTHFHVSETVVNLSITLYLLGYCAGPFLFSPLSEFYGRRWVMWFSFLAYVAFTLLTTFPPNLGGFLIGRLLAGIFVSAPIANTPGVYADIWDPVRRDNSMIMFATVVWSGPNIGLVAAAFLDESQGWRWAFYLILLVCALNMLLMLTIPETNATTILYQKAMRIRRANIPGYERVKAPTEANDETILQKYKVALMWPWAIAADTISFLCNIYLGVVFTLQFMLYAVYPVAFAEIRGMATTTAQLPLLGAVVGALLAACILFCDTRWRARMTATAKHECPERRLYMAMIGGVGFPLAMFWFAWTAHYATVHWVVPTLAGTFLSTALVLIFVAYVNYLVESYAHVAAILVAANTVFRSLGSAAAPLFTTYMFNAMGLAGAASLIAGVAVVLAFIPFYFYRYGRNIRSKSKYTVTIEASNNQKDEEEAR